MKQVMKKQIREVKIEDLLGRDEIKISMDEIKANFHGKTVMVTGAAGSIGSEICRQLLDYNPQRLILVDIDETELHDLCLRLLNYEHEWSDRVVPVVCDIKNAEKLERVFKEHKPDIVFHAAAYKHVPLMELYPEEAVNTNICGSYNVFKAASDVGTKRVVVISTDKAVNPTNIMGATKRVVEIMSAAFNKETKTEFCCVRFGNVIGSRGSMLPLFLEQIKEGKPITVTDRKIIRYFMAIPEAVSLVFKAATLAKGGEVMVLEIKSANNKNFETIKRYGMKKIKPVYHTQLNCYLGLTGMKRGVWRVINKETEEIYEEVLDFDDKKFHLYEGLKDTGAINKNLVTNDILVEEIAVVNESLESYYLGLTGGNENV